jgi:hypothetical protein
MAKYEQPRPPINANLRRALEVESGHACAVVRCGEHTYLELHHINQNREDNRMENLVLLCDKHHKMAHAGVIDRKALREYKRLLRGTYSSDLHERVLKLEALLAQGASLRSDSTDGTVEPEVEGAADTDVPFKTTTPRSDLMSFTLEQLALARFERESRLLFDRQARITRGDSAIRLDALRQDDSLPEDVIVEVRWLRKRYLDAPIWVRQVDAAVSAYELMTGRRARGVLVFVVPKADMKTISDLPYTATEIERVARKPEVVIYTYEELGFDPGAVSSALFTSNMKFPTDAV